MTGEATHATDGAAGVRCVAAGRQGSVDAWLDVSAGVAGDMLLGALVDAGADLAAVQRAVDAVVPESVRLTTHTVDRGGQRATKLEVEVLVENPPHRTWASIRETLRDADLEERTRDLAHATFHRLAEAEGRVHGIAAEDVHFHEVGALDSVADVVGVCEAVRLLRIGSVRATPIALGSGRIRAAHGFIPVPVPAVTQLSLGWPVLAAPDGVGDAHSHSHSHSHDGEHAHGHSHGSEAGDHAHAHTHSPGGDADEHPHTHSHDGDAHAHPHSHTHSHEHGPVDPQRVGELATPTGVALVRTLAGAPSPLPRIVPRAIGVGAGTKDMPSWPNVVRVVLGDTDPAGPAAPAGPPAPARTAATPSGDGAPHEVVEVRANVDDADPRIWPSVLDALLEAGAVDAWLTPVLMKKGRPGHVVTALAPLERVDAVEDELLDHTPTLGVRRTAPLARRVRVRRWETVTIAIGGADHDVRIKVGLGTGSDGARVVTSATPEYEDAARLARDLGRPVHVVLAAAAAAVAARGLVPGAGLTG